MNSNATAHMTKTVRPAPGSLCRIWRRKCADVCLLEFANSLQPTGLELVELGGKDIAIQAAKNFRKLRALGFTVRKTIDTIIATRCIEGGYTLLHADRDFEPFVKHLGLRSAV